MNPIYEVGGNLSNAIDWCNVILVSSGNKFLGIYNCNQSVSSHKKQSNTKIRTSEHGIGGRKSAVEPNTEQLACLIYQARSHIKQGKHTARVSDIHSLRIFGQWPENEINSSRPFRHVIGIIRRYNIYQARCHCCASDKQFPRSCSTSPIRPL